MSVSASAHSPDDGTCDIDLALSVAEFLGLDAATAETIVKAVATAAASWRHVADAIGARPNEIRRMATAFEHDDLAKALAL